MFKILMAIVFLFQTAVPCFAENEVLDQSSSQVIVRQHPKTGKPYASIVPAGAVPPDPFTRSANAYMRPDYRLLDPNYKPGDIPYQGPVSDRKKVYLFAAGLAVTGVATGAVGIATAPVAAGTAGGGGAYLAGGAAVAGTTAAASWIASHRKSKDEYKHTSESKTIFNREDQKPADQPDPEAS